MKQIFIRHLIDHLVVSKVCTYFERTYIMFRILYVAEVYGGERNKGGLSLLFGINQHKPYKWGSLTVYMYKEKRFPL